MFSSVMAFRRSSGSRSRSHESAPPRPRPGAVPQRKNTREMVCRPALWSPVFALVWVITTLGAPSSGRGRPEAKEPDSPDGGISLPAEEVRFHRGVFRAALKKRGLIDLLDLHLRDFPPSDETDRLLTAREIKLAEFADAGRPLSERRASVAEANRILEELIESNVDDPRRLNWRFLLAHSLLYDEAEPFLTHILYRGGSTTDRAQLERYTGRALHVVSTLLQELDEELDRVDHLAVAQFEALERTGYIDKLDRLAPQTKYLHLWALFYDGLWRRNSNSTRLQRLNDILSAMSENPAFLDTPHTESRVQVPCLLLAGMACRGLDDHHRARDYLDRAVSVAERLTDPDLRQRVDWAVTLAQFESIRNHRDDARFPEALDGIARLRDTRRADEDAEFSIALLAALLERSVHRARAAAAEQAGRGPEAKGCRAEAWRSLARLARSKPMRRDEVYAVLFDLIEPDGDPTRLDPLERCALMSGLMTKAQEPEADTRALLDRAVRVGEGFITQVSREAPTLVPEVLYNLGVARYRQGEASEAVTLLIQVAGDHPAFDRAPQAAALAVQIAAGLSADARSGEVSRAQRLYRSALEVLLTNHSDSREALYWRFFYGQLLEELGEFAAAAHQYALVDQVHEHYLEGVFFRIRALSSGLQEAANATPDDLAVLRRRANELFGVQRRLVALAAAQRLGRSDTERGLSLTDLLARARLMVAEAQVLPQIDQASQALEALSGFAQKYGGTGHLTGRVWRARLLAYERLGRLDEAADAIPEYIKADPVGAGPTLQSLYRSMAGDVERLRLAGDSEQALRKAQVALLLAEQIHDRADPLNDFAAPDERRALKVQLAEANLNAGQYERACELFERSGSSESGVPTTGTMDLRSAYGHAESLFQLERVEQALEEFNRLATGLPPDDPIRWRSLIRDLQCRTALHHPPQDVLKVIDQQRYLYPDLGGASLTTQFEELYRRNRRLLDGG